MDVAVDVGVAALVAAFVVPISIEWLKRPRLEIVPSPWLAAGPVVWTFATVRIRNKPLRGPFRKTLSRDAAQGCTVLVGWFGWASGERVMPPVPGRWSSHPEPLRSVPSPPADPAAYSGGTAILNPNYRPFTEVYDPTLVRREHDVAASEGGEEVAVAILLAGEALPLAIRPTITRHGVNRISD